MQTKAGQFELRDQFEASYVAVWERDREGGFGRDEYVGILRAEADGELAAALKALGIRRALWPRLNRVWQSRRKLDSQLDADIAARLKQ
jgi:hypothetical protein